MKQALLEVPLKEIYVPESRLREDYGDPGLSAMLSEPDDPSDDEEDEETGGTLGRSRSRMLARSMGTYGQILPIKVAKLDRSKYPGTKSHHQWRLIDGGRRYRAAFLLYAMEQTIPNVENHCILAVTSWTDDDVKLRMHEFFANENRMDFSWYEKMKFYGEIHAGFLSEDSTWTASQTAQELHISNATISKYLRMGLKRNRKHLKVARVQRTFNAAYEYFERSVRAERDVRSGSPVSLGGVGNVSAPILPGAASGGPVTVPESLDINEVALKIVEKGDCREWIKQFDKDVFSWCHWDPPYGGEEDGGAHAAHERIDDSPAYARKLMRDMVPEISRVLRPGGWLAIWYHPQHYDWLRKLLSGHEHDIELGTYYEDKEAITTVRQRCKHCDAPWADLPEVCWKRSWRFWVNPYPCVWYKEGHRDGHSIKRHLTKQTEYFLLASKVTPEDRSPPLPHTKRSNVFVAEVPRGENRRHVMHKPTALIREIVGVISNEATLGFDPSVGSGSAVEAALYSGRSIRTCELSEAYWLGAVESTRRVLFNLANGIDPSAVPSTDESADVESASSADAASSEPVEPSVEQETTLRTTVQSADASS